MASGDRPSTGKKSKGSAEELSPEEQRKRFIETAKRLEADESGEAFEGALEKIVKPKS